MAHPSSLNDPDDPWSWHELDDHPPMAMRRSRRIDVWVEGDILQIDAMFRDNAWDPDGQESVVHEYHMEGSADRSTGLLRTVTAEPRVLPYNECTGAAAQRIVDGGHGAPHHAYRGARASQIGRLLHPSQ